MPRKVGVRNQWVWGMSGVAKYAVKAIERVEVRQTLDSYLVVARLYDGSFVGLKAPKFESEKAAIAWINETFPSK